MSYSQQTSTGGGVGDVPAGCPLAKLGRSSPPYHHPSLADSYHNPSSRKQYSDINAVKTAAAYHLNCSHDTYPGEMIPLQTYSALACSRTKTPDTVLRNSPYDPYHSRDSPASFDSYHHQAKNSDNVRNSPAYELYCNLKNTDNGLPNRASYECFRNTNESENGYPNISTYERYPYTNDSSQDFDPYRNLKQHEDMLPNPYEHYHRPNKAEALTNSSSIYEHYHTQSKNENSPSAVCNSYHIRQKSESEVMNQVSYEHYFKSEGDRMVPGKSDTNMKSLEAYEKIKKRDTSDARVPSNYDPYSAKTPDGVVRNSPAFEHYFSGQSSQWRYRPMEPRDTAYHIYRNETSYDSNANASYVYPNESLAASIYEKRYRSSGSEPFSLPHEQTYHSAVTQQSCNYIVDQIGKLGRSSPSLDQGYHTLVSPSPGPSTPGPWTESKNVFKGKSKIITRNNCFAMLPDNAILKIFAWLSSSELCVCAQVCRRFEHLVWDPSMWRTINLRGPSVSGDKAVRSILQRLSGHDQNAMCPTVERVFVSEGTRLTDKGLVLLARHCPELTHLQTQGCATLSNAALCELVTRCHNLQHLDVTGCTRLSTLAILEMPRKLQLQYLDLTDCSSVDDNSLRIIVENCPQLVYLYLRRCVQITDAGIKCVPSFCSALRELSVSDCVNLTDFGLYELAKLGATLRYLSVAKCDQVSDPGLKVIVRRCYKLRYLNARGCEAVSDDAITELARSCPRLRALDIGKCDVSDAGLAALAESCPNLKKLSLRSCELITDKGVECIAYYCRGLQLLNIQDCQITIEGYRAVKKYCKRCVIEHTNPGFF